ncbi:type I secretion system permease/ATPase [Sphingomonas spermidinifaciens]|uniref:Type I secretion system permease/ATPase n=1 Tax=Sphingomonas spermidinifaciens TaxID=1141889 RepID=A0A2A4B8Q9_9SPHN|nr:type I secretion system permease/ATPase [Sphingomonas spermidinifaciens]PCD04016.1 type I secretion system permease/ATPase [Sphingomonas spermidinifaciens]
MSDPDLIAPRPPRFAEWLSQPMLRNRGLFLKVALAAVLINLFGLIVSLFTMTVYDRVVPNLAFDSLTALSIGVGIVLVFDFALRILRAYFVDVAGADIDREIGGNVFDRLMRIRLDLKRGSVGQLSGLMRELETLRDFFASATLTAIVDVPFIVLTLIFIGFIGGPIVFVPLILVPIVIAAGYLTHPALDRLSARSMAGGLSKQSVLVESIGSIEMVKTSGAQKLLEKRWLKAIDDHADSSMRQRLISTIAVTIATSANSAAYMGVVVFGVFLIAERELTTGGLVACSILAGRAVQPLAQIAQLMSRISATRTAYRQLNGLMSVPSEGPVGQPLYPGRLSGRIELKNVSFRYPGASEKTLDQFNFTVEPGQRVALIGRVGSGKSTVARLMLGLYPPQEGLVLIDGTDIRQFDPDGLRANIGTALQETVLLSGSVRENIALDRPHIDDAEMLRAAQLSGAHGFMGQITNGYDLILADRGEGLSGGQRQSITLARALAGRPPILIFDEPTSAMDSQTEAALIDRLAEEMKGRTLVMITHRSALLRLADRIVIVEAGKVVADGPRDTILQQLSRPRAAA